MELLVPELVARSTGGSGKPVTCGLELLLMQWSWLGDDAVDNDEGTTAAAAGKIAAAAAAAAVDGKGKKKKPIGVGMILGLRVVGVVVVDSEGDDVNMVCWLLLLLWLLWLLMLVVIEI